MKWANILSATHKTHIIYTTPAAEMRLICLYLSVCLSRLKWHLVCYVNRQKDIKKQSKCCLTEAQQVRYFTHPPHQSQSLSVIIVL